MNKSTQATHRYLIVGAGITGVSAARYFYKQGIDFFVFDTRHDESLRQGFMPYCCAEKVMLGEYQASVLNTVVLNNVTRILISPGVSKDTAVIADAQARGIEVVSDITVFLENITSPVVGVTGTNGKSTVTTMLGLMLENAGMCVGVGGNIGIPALDLVEAACDIFVLELSSFQLESTHEPCLEVAVHLNITQDHLDRHESFAQYALIKQRIFEGAKHIVFNAEDSGTFPQLESQASIYSFGATVMDSSDNGRTQAADFTLDMQTDKLVKSGKALFPRSLIKLKGRHNVNNVLALCAVAEALNVDTVHVQQVAKTFSGLEHRCELVDSIDGVSYINDSKATNVGATISAINSYSDEYKHLILIAGGVGKSQSFSELGRQISEKNLHTVLFGEAKNDIAESVENTHLIRLVDNLDSALRHASKLALAGDGVLFSPACASFDQYKNYQQRGEAFKKAVGSLRDAS